MKRPLILHRERPWQLAANWDFNYAIHSPAARITHFTQEMIPAGEVTSVPRTKRPGLASGLLFGGIQLVKRLRRKV